MACSGQMLQAVLVKLKMNKTSFSSQIGGKHEKNMDSIQFESRTEIVDLMKVIDKYIKQNPAETQNKTAERFFDLMDVMLMEW